MQSNNTQQVGSRQGRKQVVSIIAQIRALRDRDNWLAFTIGGLIGSFVPIAVYALNHYLLSETHSILSAIREGGERWPIMGLILAGAVFSAKSVYGWGLSAFAMDRWKAAGYCILIEGILVVSPLEWLRAMAMVYLVAINVIATGANLMEIGPRLDNLDHLIKELEQGKSKAEIAERKGWSVRHLNRVLAARQ